MMLFKRQVLCGDLGFLVKRRNFKQLRFYGDDKYKSIEDFNKNKKEYLFGHNFSSLDELSENDRETTPKQGRFGNKNSNTESLHRRISEKELHQAILNGSIKNMDSIISQDPRLSSLEKSSEEYQMEASKITNEFRKRQKKYNARQRTFENLRTIGAGALILVGMVSGHQIFMHYGYLKNKLLYPFRFGNDDSNAASLDDPNKNTRNSDNLAKKLSSEVNDDFINGLVNLQEKSGLYVFGVQNDHKLPCRISYFDDMLLKDVKMSDKYLAVVDNDGNLYQVYNELNNPQVTELPHRIEKCSLSDEFVYLLTNKGEVLYLPRADKRVDNFEGKKERGLMGSSKILPYNKISFEKLGVLQGNHLSTREKVADISSGAHHLLILTNQGRLFISKTQVKEDKLKNFGQFGIPDLSPFSSNLEGVPSHYAFPLTLLNTEITQTQRGKSLKDRKFAGIASGKYHNIVLEENGDIWTWGSNKFGQCGIQISYNTDIQPVPVKLFSEKDMRKIMRFDSKTEHGSYSVSRVYASSDNSYFMLARHPDGQQKLDGDILVSFGNGLTGQLGINRYLHVCSEPQIVKGINNLVEYDEETHRTKTIGVKDVSVGGDHVFITIDNDGQYKDVLVFGDNHFGQFGNGKTVKSANPTNIPKLLEPQDFQPMSKENKGQLKQIAKKLNDTTTNRMELLSGVKLANGQKIEQVIVASDKSSAIFYKKT